MIIMRKIKHHFIPKFYLKGFCDTENSIYVYCKKTGKWLGNPPGHINCNCIACINDFYSIETKDGESDTFENALSDIIDNTATTKVFTAINYQKTLSTDERERLSMFIAFMIVRTPHYRSHLDQLLSKDFNTYLQIMANNEKRFLEWAEDYKKREGQPLADNLEKLRLDIQKGILKPRPHQNFMLQAIKDLAFTLAPLIIEMKWTFLETRGNIKFITSDNPVIIRNSNVNGYYRPSLCMNNTQLIFPISKNQCLIAIKTEQNIVERKNADDFLVKEINQNIAKYACEYIYSCSQTNFDYNSTNTLPSPKGRDGEKE